MPLGREARCFVKGPAMTRVSLFSSPYLLGFDDFERIIDRAAKSAHDGYPPYNIERVARGENAPEKFRITLAVAGFSRDELEITIEENQLMIRGRQVDDGSRAYLHRGIAARGFIRSFVLADGVEVDKALLEHGLLHIDLSRPEPDKLVKRIPIQTAG